MSRDKVGCSCFICSGGLDKDVCQSCDVVLTEENRVVIPISSGPEDIEKKEFCRSCAETITESEE